MTPVYIGLGSNVDSPRQQLESSLQALGDISSTRVIGVSSFYKSKPVGPENQDDYINAVAKLETGLTATELLDNLQSIEAEHGRVRTGTRWGPRSLDLDILLFGNDIIKDERLIIPHVEILNRSFVLIPLAEIAPDCEIPGVGSISTYVNKLDTTDLKKLQ